MAVQKSESRGKYQRLSVQLPHQTARVVEAVADAETIPQAALLRQLVTEALQARSQAGKLPEGITLR